MVTPSRFRQICLSLKGTKETPHASRAAFRVARIYATLKADEASANVKLGLDEQALLAELHPGVMVPVPGGWGRMGWTTVHLAKVAEPVLSQMLASAWTTALPNPAKTRRKTK